MTKARDTANLVATGVLDASFDWQAPTAMPDDDKKYTWNEDTTSWELE